MFEWTYHIITFLSSQQENTYVFLKEKRLAKCEYFTGHILCIPVLLN